MIQRIKDNKMFIILTIIAILLTIIIVLMFSGSKIPTVIQTTGGSIGIGVPDNSTAPIVTMPPEMQPKPHVLVTFTPTPVVTPYVGG